MTMRPPLRKLLLTLHITTSVGLLGAVAAFLALALVGLAAVDIEAAHGAYFAMERLTTLAIVPLAFIMLLVGLIQSLGTRWGLFQHYWIVFKLALTLLAVGVLLLQLGTIAMLSTATDLAPFATARFSMVLHSAGGCAVLLLATVLSVYKPRGRLPRRKPAAA